MTMQERVVKNKMGLMELAEYLQNVSEACKINGVSRQHFYDIKKAYEEKGYHPQVQLLNQGGNRYGAPREADIHSRLCGWMSAFVIEMLTFIKNSRLYRISCGMHYKHQWAGFDIHLTPQIVDM